MALATDTLNLGVHTELFALDNIVANKLHDKVQLLEEWCASKLMVYILGRVEPVWCVMLIELAGDILRAIEAYTHDRSLIIWYIAI